MAVVAASSRLSVNTMVRLDSGSSPVERTIWETSSWVACAAPCVWALIGDLTFPDLNAIWFSRWPQCGHRVGSAGGHHSSGAPDQDSTVPVGSDDPTSRYPKRGWRAAHANDMVRVESSGPA